MQAFGVELMVAVQVLADFQPNGEAPVSASAIAIKGELMTPEGSKPYTVPRALEEAELPALIEDYRKGARNALDAGFDGAVPMRAQCMVVLEPGQMRLQHIDVCS